MGSFIDESDRTIYIGCCVVDRSWLWIATEICGGKRDRNAFVFPTDHGAHPEFKTEWWYYTGNLDAADGRQFGYQLTFFRSALSPETRT